MKGSMINLILYSMLLAKIWSNVDIAQAPLAMDLTADLEERILKQAQRELDSNSNASGEQSGESSAKTSENAPQDSELDAEMQANNEDQETMSETVDEEDVADESIEDQLKDIRHRLYKIEDKLDHVLYHHGHEVTPHEMHMSPFGVMGVPKSKNPNSAHNQMKMNDHMMNPFHPMGGAMMNPMMMHPAMMGMNPMMMNPAMMGAHPAMMGGMMMGGHPGMMGMPYGLGAMTAHNYPIDQSQGAEGAEGGHAETSGEERRLITLN